MTTEMTIEMIIGLIPIELWDRILYFSNDLCSSLLICKLLTITRGYRRYTLQRIVDLYGGDTIMNFGVKWCRTNELLVCSKGYYRYYIAGKLLYTCRESFYWFTNGIELYEKLRCICLPDPKAYKGLVVYEYSKHWLCGIDTGYIHTTPHDITYRIDGAPNRWVENIPENTGYQTGDVVLDPGTNYWIWFVCREKFPEVITKFGVSPALDDLQTERCIEAIAIANSTSSDTSSDCDTSRAYRNPYRVTDVLNPKNDLIEGSEFVTAEYIYESLVKYVDNLVTHIKKWNPHEQTLDNPKPLIMHPITLQKIRRPKYQTNYNRIFYY
jgi:hypothetical protein